MHMGMAKQLPSLPAVKLLRFSRKCLIICHHDLVHARNMGTKELLRSAESLKAGVHVPGCDLPRYSRSIRF